MQQGTAISFDGNSLQTANIITGDIDHHGGPTKSMPMYAVAHGNRSAIPWVGYPAKQITITGTLKSDSVADMDALIDTFKGYFTGVNANLDIGYNGGTRRYIATAQSPDVKRPGGLTHATFTVVFDCTYPFGQDINPTTAFNVSSRTLGIYADAITLNGSAPYQYCLITITYGTITGGTAASVVIGNNANNQQITITRNWATNDVLQIDVLNKTVSVNGTQVDYTGAFPEFPKGANYLGYTDTLTTRSFTELVTYYARWL